MAWNIVGKITILPHKPADDLERRPPNPARAVQTFIGGFIEIISTPLDWLNRKTAQVTTVLANALGIGRYPAARLRQDMVRGLPHFHGHWPFILPPSTGWVVFAGARNVLINGKPAVRNGDMGFAAWCGGWVPIFEVLTGSASVFMGGARSSRQNIDLTLHCFPNPMSKIGLAVSAGVMAFSAGMGVLGYFAAATDQKNLEEEAENAESESEAKALAADAHVAGIEAQVTAEQTKADLAAMAMGLAMGLDPGFPPPLCLGKFVTGSPNVLVGGFPMPGWEMIIRGLGGLLKRRRAPKARPRRKQNEGCDGVCEPIDVVTGANVDNFIDFTLPAPRFVWRRWYNSQQQEQAEPLGWGFRHEYQQELRYGRSTSQYTYTDQEGNSVPFPPFVTDYPSEQVTQHGYALKRLSERRFELTAHDKPAIEFEFSKMSELARPVALRDGERNFTFDHDAQGRLIGIRIDEERTVRLNYSPAGLAREVLLERPGQSGQETVHVARYQYDDDGCLIEFRDALDRVARYEYDQARRMTRKTDRRGYSYRYQYDEQGRCVYTSGEDGMYEGWLEYHPEDRAALVKYSDGGSWVYEYNELGTITKIADPYGGTRRRIIDPDTGVVIRELDPAGNPTELLYNEQGAHTGRRDPWGYWAPPLDVEPHPADPLEHKVPETPLEWEFGNLLDRNFIGVVSHADPLLKDFPEVAAEIAQSRPAGTGAKRRSAMQEKHDLLGRLIERQGADGSIERLEYDAEGNETLYIDGDGRTYRKEYSSWNLLLRETDPAGNICEFQYSPTEKITRFVDAGGAAHDFTYDKKDRLIAVRHNGTTHDIYRYDEADNLIEKLDGEGKSLLVCDPGFGRLDRVRRFADGEVYHYEYDRHGRITKAQTRRDRMVLDYDEEGISTRDERNGLGVEKELSGGELVSTTVFGKFVAEYGRQYDGSLTITDPTGRAHTFYFGDGGLILKELANGTKELVQYDAQGRFLRKVLSSADGARYSKSYRYSAAGDLSQTEDGRVGTVKYHYDAAHRLKVAEREDGRNELYAHDKAGNLILQPGLDGVRMSPGNKLKTANGEQFHYDHRDNVVMRKSERKTTGYEYDSFDQLVGISLNGREWRADYDALGRRTRKRWSGQSTEYYWDHDRLSGEIRADGSVRVYVYADEHALTPFLYVDYASLDAEPEKGTVKYLFTNHLGVPERVEDESGRAIWQGEVSPYGAIRVEFGSRNEINLRFPGHYYDVETGLHYNRFRYYDPALGRYLQSDPLGIAGGSNLHAYLANPLTGVDLLGLAKKGECDGNGKPQNDGQPGGPVRPAKEGPPDTGAGAGAAPQKAKRKSLRRRYLGRTPGKNSSVGRKVQERMRNAKPPTLRDGPKGVEFKASDGEWHPLKNADMTHTPVDAVTWWNTEGRKYGARSPEVRRWMRDPNNYTLDHYSRNRSEGGRITEGYLPPLK